LVISNRNSFRVLFDEIASVYFTWKIYLYCSIWNGRPEEPALCQLYRHTFVPCRRRHARETDGNGKPNRFVGSVRRFWHAQLRAYVNNADGSLARSPQLTPIMQTRRHVSMVAHTHTHTQPRSRPHSQPPAGQVTRETSHAINSSAELVQWVISTQSHYRPKPISHSAHFSDSLRIRHTGLQQR